MKQTVIKYGLTAGAIVIASVFVIGTLYQRDLINIRHGEYIGYTGMLVSLTMVFLGIRSYREQHNGGSISFLKAMQIGLLISAIAAVMYFLGGELYNIWDPEFGPKMLRNYTEYQLGLMQTKGAAAAEIDAMSKQMGEFVEMYKNPLVRFGVSLIEFVPVGLIVTVVSSLILRRALEEK